MNLFNLFNRLNATEQAIDNPQKAGTEFFKGIIEGYVLLATFWILAIIGVLAFFAFSSYLGGPYEWVEIVLYIFCVIVALIIITLAVIYRWLKRKLLKVQQSIKTKAGATFAKPVKATNPDKTNKSNTISLLGK